MQNKYILALCLGLTLAGCQSSPVVQKKNAPTSTTTDRWNGEHLDLVQFVTEEQGFSCLAPSGVDITSDGKAVKKTLCFKTEKCETTIRTLYLDAHSMQVTSTVESAPKKDLVCQPTDAPSSAIPK